MKKISPKRFINNRHNSGKGLLYKKGLIPKFKKYKRNHPKYRKVRNIAALAPTLLADPELAFTEIGDAAAEANGLYVTTANNLKNLKEANFIEKAELFGKRLSTKAYKRRIAPKMKYARKTYRSGARAVKNVSRLFG